MERTDKLGPGEYFLPHLEAEWEEASTFRARELFVDALEDVAPEACEDFRGVAEPIVRQVFEARGNRETLEALLRDRGLSWDWPPGQWPPYGEGFGGWPPPTPRGTLEQPWHVMHRTVVTRSRCWRFHGWLTRTILRDNLDEWSAKWNLAENRWVAGHLLARMCKARFLADAGSPTESAKLDHIVFPSPGVLAWFGECLEKVFFIPDRAKDGGHRFRQWDPTQEAWSEWKKAAEAVFGRALTDYRARVLEECSNRSIEPTPQPRHLERDLRRLVRFQVLRNTHEELRSEGEYDTKAVQKAISRVSPIVGLKLRTSVSDSP